MPGTHPAIARSLGLRPGDVVEIRSAAEILATLDADGTMDGLPFMPEMLACCGKRYRVYKRADKTCDTVGTSPTHARRMRDTVHLDTPRCDGSAHGGCQAQCLVFWKEAWLTRVTGRAAVAHPEPVAPEALVTLRTRRSLAAELAGSPPAYVCQATELVRASEPLPWWDARQYLRDLWSGNVGLPSFVATMARAAFNAVQRFRGGRQFPSVEARCEGQTPTGRLDLRPGELVRIRSKEEIFATLNQQGRNRGLYFDVEMLPFCGRTAIVRARIDRIINEKTGEMLHFSNPCIMLEGATCSGCLSRERLFCPRSIYSYWREIWLERVGVAERPPRDVTATPPASERVTAGIP